MYCEKCGKTNDDNANNCVGCGARLSGTNPRPAPQPVGAPAPAAVPGPAPLGHLVPMVVVALLLYLPGTLMDLFFRAGRVFEVASINKFLDGHAKGVMQAFLLFNVLELVSIILIFTILFSIVGSRRR
jgi:hypothetical protein